MMSATRSLSENYKWGNLWAIGSWSIQLSNHRLMESPFPRFHLLPRWMKDDRIRIFFQIQEPPFGLPSFQRDDLLKYLDLNYSTQRKSDVIADQPNFNKEASLTSFTLRKPRLPSNFGKQTVSHLMKLLCSFSRLQTIRSSSIAVQFGGKFCLGWE